MSDVRDLYQEVILDHSKHPHNFKEMADADHRADGHNPLCGDRLTVYLKVRAGRIEDVGFHGSGCAISVASASMMTDALKGLTLEDAEGRFRDFHNLLTCQVAPDPERLGKLVVFSGVRRFPVRVKCATLAWHTLRAALDASQRVVSTE